MIRSKLKVLFVEDDLVLSYVVTDYLLKQNYEVVHCADGGIAWNQFMKNIFNICLIDIMLPGSVNGLDLANNIRKKNEEIPIILVSSKNTDSDRIAGFENGADGYLAKPYNLEELCMRINVLLKRSKKSKHSVPYLFKIGDLNFDYINLVVGNDKISHQLTQREADLMRYLCLNANRLVTRNEILINIWGKNDFLLGRSMDVFITKIRRYIRTQNVVKIQNVRGKGFIYNYDSTN